MNLLKCFSLLLLAGAAGVVQAAEPAAAGPLVDAVAGQAKSVL